MADIAFCSFYIILFSIIILKAEFFRLPAFGPYTTIYLFYLKLICAVALWYLYSHISAQRFTSDIFKHFDDGVILYNRIHKSPGDFIKMITGIHDSDPAIHAIYAQMNSWANGNQSLFYDNSHFIIRLNALFMLLSLGHYGVHVIFMCFLSLTGLVLIYKRFYRVCSNTRIGLLAAIFLFPSVLLWSSGIIKEPIVFAGMGLLLYYFDNLMQSRGNKLKNIILTLLGIVIIFENKSYAAICVLPCMLSDLAIGGLSFCRRRPGLTYLTITSCYLFLGININLFGAPISPLGILAAKQTDFNHIANSGIYLEEKNDNDTYAFLPSEDTLLLLPASNYTDSILRNRGFGFMSCPAFTSFEIRTKRFAYFTLRQGTKYKQFHNHYGDTTCLTAETKTLYWLQVYGEPAKSRIQIEPISHTLAGLISHVPQALAITLIRPFPGEIHSLTAFLEFVENILLWVLVIVAFISPKRFLKSVKSEIIIRNEFWRTFYFCLTYCLLMFTLIGLVTPLYGGIERYRTLAMPFLLILLLLIFYKRTQS